MVMCPDGKERCWSRLPEIYVPYHDEEWGVPVHDDRRLFEVLVLAGAQAGLSWAVVLQKREGYRAVFHGFDVARVAAMTDAEVERALKNPRIIRHAKKVRSVRTNARVFAAIQDEFGSFDAYVWGFVGGSPIIGNWEREQDLPAQTSESKALAKDLRRRGMTCIGPRTIYVYMQSVGMVDAHLTNCWVRQARRRD